MIANILVAIGFFAFGFLVGGISTVYMIRKVKEEHKDVGCIIIDTYAD